MSVSKSSVPEPQPGSSGKSISPSPSLSIPSLHSVSPLRNVTGPPFVHVIANAFTTFVCGMFVCGMLAGCSKSCTTYAVGSCPAHFTIENIPKISIAKMTFVLTLVPSNTMSIIDAATKISISTSTPLSSLSSTVYVIAPVGVVGLLTICGGGVGKK